MRDCLNHRAGFDRVLMTVAATFLTVSASSALAQDQARSSAAEVVSLLEPNILVPMHYATPDVKVSLDSLGKFLKEMGLGKPESQASLKVSRSSLPEETHVVVLEYQRE